MLPKVLHRWGPIPGALGTRDLTGPWDTPGSARTVLLEDGSTAHEEVLAWERPRRFEYRVSRLTNRFGRLVLEGRGVWEFSSADADSGPAGSGFRWTYSIWPRRRLARPVLAVAVGVAWSRYMEQCADLCVAVARGDD